VGKTLGSSIRRYPLQKSHRPGGRPSRPAGLAARTGCRGHAIGKYIPDFCSPKAKLIIELDGSQHLDQEAYDEERTQHLESQGYTVLRFWNNDVMKDIESVIRAIIQVMESERHL
jgi:very-short-patch-repair endonuclease